MHRKLHVESTIQINVSNLNMPAGGVGVPSLTKEFMSFPSTVHRLGRAVSGVGSQPEYEPVKEGASTNSSRNFVWLPYVPGLITLVQFDRTKSICTGWMSGCWLVRCQANGMGYFAHIGTAHNPHDLATIAVKNAFKIAVRAGLIQVQRAFQPMCDESEKTMGVLSARGNFHTIGFSATASGLPPVTPEHGVDRKTVKVSAPMPQNKPSLSVVTKTQEDGRASLPLDF